MSQEKDMTKTWLSVILLISLGMPLILGGLMIVGLTMYWAYGPKAAVQILPSHSEVTIEPEVHKVKVPVDIAAKVTPQPVQDVAFAIKPTLTQPEDVSIPVKVPVKVNIERHEVLVPVPVAPKPKPKKPDVTREGERLPNPK